MIEALFTCLIVLQFAVIVAHDLVDIPGWVHGSQVQAMMGNARFGWPRLPMLLFPTRRRHLP